MVRQTARFGAPAKEPLSEGLRLSVEGFKAVRTRQELRIAPLTIIAGVNSSGKSSFMQPFLMMKQTLDSAFDPGPLLLHGANVKVTEYAQMFSRGKSKTDAVDQFTVGMTSDAGSRQVTFGIKDGRFRIMQDVATSLSQRINLSDPLPAKQRRELRETVRPHAESYEQLFQRRGSSNELNAVSWEPVVTRNRCFLQVQLEINAFNTNYRFELPFGNEEEDGWVDLLRGIIHVPGLRGNPERAYQRSAVGNTYPGTFDTYVANIVNDWGEKSSSARLAALAQDLERLGLTWKIVARRVDDASIELMVGRMPHAQQGGAFDLVSMADVGFGVSQTLPVLVALLAARPGQIVYIEQPEIHLHPRAQFALADSLVDAANRGVVVIAETHSSLLIRGIQIAVARGKIGRNSLSLNWFGRDETGSQEIAEAALDQAGRFGDWPIDFDDVSQQADWAYLDAVEGV